MSVTAHRRKKVSFKVFVAKGAAVSLRLSPWTGLGLVYHNYL